MVAVWAAGDLVSHNVTLLSHFHVVESNLTVPLPSTKADHLRKYLETHSGEKSDSILVASW